MTTPDDLERQHTLTTAVTRYDVLRGRDAMANPVLSRAECLEMLALGEVLTRKAAYGRQLGVRSARAAGASWSQLGEALGTTKQSAWEAHSRWIDDQAGQHRRLDYTGFDSGEVAAARALAGEPEG